MPASPIQVIMPPKARETTAIGTPRLQLTWATEAQIM